MPSLPSDMSSRANRCAHDGTEEGPRAHRAPVDGVAGDLPLTREVLDMFPSGALTQGLPLALLSAAVLY